MEPAVMSVGEAARRAGLSTRALRLYEALGIVREVARTPSGYRTYTADQVELLRFVRRARDLGLSLQEVRQFLDSARREPPPRETVVDLLERHAQDTRHRLAQLAELHGILAELLERAGAGDGRGEPVRLCRLIASRQG